MHHPRQVPGITTRVVHDQAIKIVRRVLLNEGVVAEVRLHTVSRPQAVSGRQRAPAVVIDERGADRGTDDRGTDDRGTDNRSAGDGLS